jgi:hypothetical protein
VVVVVRNEGRLGVVDVVVVVVEVEVEVVVAVAVAVVVVASSSRRVVIRRQVAGRQAGRGSQVADSPSRLFRVFPVGTRGAREKKRWGRTFFFFLPWFVFSVRLLGSSWMGQGWEGSKVRQQGSSRREIGRGRQGKVR